MLCGLRLQNSTAAELEAVRRQYQSAVAEMERQREEEERQQQDEQEEQAIEAVHSIIDQGQLSQSADLCLFATQMCIFFK